MKNFSKRLKKKKISKTVKKMSQKVCIQIRQNITIQKSISKTHPLIILKELKRKKEILSSKEHRRFVEGVILGVEILENL